MVENIKKKSLLKWIITCFLIIAAAGLISRYAYRLMLIQGDSMKPAYHNMQIVVLDVHSKDYSPGDVVAFDCPGFDSVLVKRIVAGPQDCVCITDEKLMINGAISPDFEDACFEFAGLLETEYRLGADEYIVIGDNIKESKDSRYGEVGVVSGDSIIGKILKGST